MGCWLFELAQLSHCSIAIQSLCCRNKYWKSKLLDLIAQAAAENKSHSHTTHLPRPMSSWWHQEESCLLCYQQHAPRRGLTSSPAEILLPYYNMLFKYHSFQKRKAADLQDSIFLPQVQTWSPNNLTLIIFPESGSSGSNQNYDYEGGIIQRYSESGNCLKNRTLQYLFICLS